MWLVYFYIVLGVFQITIEGTNKGRDIPLSRTFPTSSVFYLYPCIKTGVYTAYIPAEVKR